MSKTEVIKKIKFDFKQVIAKLNAFHDYIIACDPLTNKIQINERFLKCEPLWNDFDKLICECEYLEESSLQNERKEFEDTYFETICLFKEKLTVNSDQVNSNSNVTSNSNPAKLPSLDLPSFDGKYEKWTSFFDTFIALIHSNSNLSNVQKFYYLQSSLKGEASQAIASIQVTELNYEIAFKLLRERYENKRLIVQSHVKALFDLPQVSKNNHFELRKFIDGVQKNVRALKSLNEQVESWDTILLYLFNQKLDLITKSEWEAFSIKNSSTKYDDFIKFLLERSQVLESVHSSFRAREPIADARGPKLRAFVASRNNKQCLFCKNGDHWFSNCTEFLKLAESQRFKEIKKLHLCLNCLKPNHVSSACTFYGCKKCGKPHHYLLHIDFSTVNKQESSISQFKPEPENQGSATKDNFTAHVSAMNPLELNQSVRVSAHSANNFESEVLLSTAKVLVSDKNGKCHEVRALLDCGSQSNFISKELVSRLNLNTNEVNMSIVGVNSSVTSSNKSVNLTIQSMCCQFSINLDFFVLNKIANQLPTSFINKDKFKVPGNIKLADLTFNVPGSIDLLLGAGVFYDLLLVGRIKIADNMPVIQKTRLGWIVSGSVLLKNDDMDSEVSCMQTMCSFSSNQIIQRDLEKFWAIDEVQPTKVLRKEESECEELFIKTTIRGDDGKLIVELPTKDGIKEIGVSREIAIRRFNNLEKKLCADTSLKEQYVNFMNEYEALGHMTVIPESEIKSSNPNYYMPHHPVVKETSCTTKLRVVFDASAKTSNGVSLNDNLKAGPIIQDELYSILIRFREHSCVIGADVEKMYRMVWIKEEQRDLQRIVWRKSPESELKHYRLNTVTYGTVPASFLAIRSLHFIADSERETFPEACKQIKTNFYVDDLLTGASSIEEAIKLKSEITEILMKSGFILRKWVSNKKEVLGVTEEEREIKHYIIEDTVTKTLGVMWNIQDDSLQYTVQTDNNLKATKRNILSVISKVFDPLGLIGPIVIRAKVILQRLWNENLDWDDKVSNELNELWMGFYKELPMLNNLNISRHALCENPIIVELHGFSDASERSYGACIYLKSVNNEGEIKIHLLCAKSKVAPMKTLTIPRLELCGALLLSRLMVKTRAALSKEVKRVHLWTDSKIVLAWLAAEAANWNVFVSHRVAEIQQTTNIDNWKHVLSEDNPADLISRGCAPEQLILSSLWWYGPSWLKNDINEWPSIDLHDPVEIPEKRVNKQKLTFFQSLDQSIFKQFSTLIRLQRVVAYCKRFFRNLTCNVNNKITGSLSVLELNESLICLIKLAQNEMFFTEINQVKSNKQLSKTSKLLALNPFLDQDNILRVGGRLGKSSISYNMKYPAILDKKHILTEMIINYEHRRNLHMGAQNLLSNLRSRFWILDGLNTIKKSLRKCVVCFRAKPKILSTLMGELPEQRLTPTRPFLNTGVDYAGPFNIKSSNLRKSKVLKAYLCLFVCFVTRAVHLEVVSDMTSESFLNSLKRFIARRGKCQTLFSDCGTNFVGANNEMSEFFKYFKDDKCQNKITEFLAQDGIKWNFIPPRSPHFGGLWESHIKLAKFHLKRVMGNNVFTFEELSTVFTQIEACLNSRPLSPISNDISDLTPLTPGHFLIGDSLVALPEPDVRDIKCNRLKRYQYLKQLVQHFWDRWYKECLSDLNRRYKWKYQQGRNIVVGDMVLLKDECLSPLKWPLGRVIAVFPGSDTIVRVVQVKTAKGTFKRAVAKICLLPLSDE